MDILWVENHEEFAHFAGREFFDGHALTVVPSLAAARLALAGATFDVVLVDYDLDDGKGTELIRELCRFQHRPGLVAVSSHEAGNQSLVKAGADAVCAKLQFGRVAQVLAGLVYHG